MKRENGGMNRRIAVLLAMMCLLCCFSAGAAENRGKVILMASFQQPDQSAEAVWLDEAGGIWRSGGDIAAPESEAGWLEIAAQSDGDECIGTLDPERLSEIRSLILAIPSGSAEARPSGRNDCAAVRCFAVRYPEQDAPEFVPLAMTGEWIMENTDVNAQAACLALWTDVLGEAPPEEIVGFECRSLAEFCGVDENAFADATVQIFDEDCEVGATERTLSDEEQAEAIEWLSRLTVTGKRSAMMVTGNTTAYVLTSPEGETLARFTFFGDSLAQEDGMYFVQEDVR